MALSLPIAWIWVLAYKTSSQRDKIDKDLDRFCQVHNGCHPGNRRLYYMLSEFVGDGGEEFRSLFLYRIGKKRHFLKHIMPHGAILLGFDVPPINWAPDCSSSTDTVPTSAQGKSARTAGSTSV